MKEDVVNFKKGGSEIKLWLIILSAVALIGFLVLGFLLLRDDDQQMAIVGDTLLSVDEKAKEVRRTYADLGTIAHTENFEFAASQLDCSQATLEAINSDEQITSKKGKFCVVDLEVKNISSEKQTFEVGDVLLRSGRFEHNRAESQVLYRPDVELGVKVFGMQLGELQPDQTSEGSLIFDLQREAVPYSIRVFDKPSESPATIYLDDWGNDGQFACRQAQALVINQTAEDCGVSYRLDSLSCDQELTIQERELKACLAEYTMTNISHQFREDSPYAPNFTYRGYNALYAAFGNHTPYLVDVSNNWYSHVYSYNNDFDYYDYELDEWQEVDINLPGGEDYLHYYNSYDKRSELNLAPGESIKGVLTFIVATDVSPKSLYLDKSYYYSYVEDNSAVLESAPSTAADSAESNASSSSSGSPAPGGQCPTCGSREF